MHGTIPGHPHLKYGFIFTDLFDSGKLKELAEIFYKYYSENDPVTYEFFHRYRMTKGNGFKPIDVSRILITAGRVLDTFVGDFFGVQEKQNEQLEAAGYHRVVLNMKKDFIQRRVFKKFKDSDLKSFHFRELDEKINELKLILFRDLNWKDDEERATAVMFSTFLDLEKHFKTYIEAVRTEYELPGKTIELVDNYMSILSGSQLLSYLGNDLLFSPVKESKASELDYQRYEFIKRVVDLFEHWAFGVYHDPAYRHKIHDWILFHIPKDYDYYNLVENAVRDKDDPAIIYGDESTLRKRDGFKLTDKRYDDRHVFNEVEYCIFCHERDKDSCSKGLKEKDGTVKRSPFGVKLHGCPLDEKISEMHFLKNEGRCIGSLALIILDNPMCPGTGHRICNDCMKGCIYQKQEPVEIPQIETGVLTDVLGMPWGFEIYSLLTRWNPLNVERPFTLPYNGKNVLVVGLGPAGYTLSHHLLNEGFAVVGIDGLKIEPMHRDITGYTDEEGLYHDPRPLEYLSEFYEELDERVFLGFGGVSEYGITVRWDKNFLKVIYLTLARRKNFRFYDGVRFGGTVTIDDAWEMGFDHIAIATGAGKPTIIRMKNNLIRGIRKASDFLMALQLSGAAKKESITNLQVQLPVIVIGGGLTAIDTATESAAYYIIQVEKYLERYEKIIEEFGEDKLWNSYDPEEASIAHTFIEHGREVRAERVKAKAENREPDFIQLIRKWGGVTIAYRKSITESPAYRLNHEEIIKALEEGIYIHENLDPVAANYNEYGTVKEIVFKRTVQTEDGQWVTTDDELNLPAKSVLVAAGTSPNIIYEREYPGTFELDEWKQFFQTYHLEADDGKFKLVKTGKNETGFFTSYNKDGKFITVYGDNHPVYAGNVVKAMASARDGYKHISYLFRDAETGDEIKLRKLFRDLDEKLIARVEEVNLLTPTIIEVIVKAPLFARKFRPGQFFKLQNYELNSLKVEGTKMLMEGLALTGAWVDEDKGLLSMIVLEMWGSSRLCRHLKKGEKVVVMGPTGTPTHIPEKETVLLAGGGLGNAVLFSIAKAMKDKGNKVIYFAGYRNSNDLFKREDIESACDQVIWSNDYGDPIKPERPQDRSINANIVQAMIAYAKGELEKNANKTLFNLRQVNRLIVIGSDRMMAAVKEARHTIMKEYINPEHVGIASINSAMQCMMKEVCAQCLQRHVDPITGKETFVFSCFNQDQLIDHVDFRNLNDRLKQNSVLEKLTKFWIDRSFEKLKIY
jgi:NADPH-dependent glutamate synthase beta subunit-like oxidoreductase/NAD(P)H-flavin reductase